MIVFSTGKNESHNAKANFCLLARKLRVCAKIKHKNEVTSNALDGCQLLVIGNAQKSFAEEELQVLQTYINGGGSVAIFASGGGESSNLNELLKDYGIRIDDSTVVRSVYHHKYHHPKHAFIANGIVQPEIGYEKHTPLVVDLQTQSSFKRPQDDITEPSTSLSFVYPNGSTLIVESPSFTLLSSGSTSYPVDCPIAAAWEGDKVGEKLPGKLLVVGSADVFSDAWLEKEENNELCEVLFRFLLHQDLSFDPSIGRADFEEQETVPCVSTLANLVKPCLLEEEPLPQDCKSLLIGTQFSMKMDRITDVIDLYKKLNVPYEPLTLIEPHFECPHPPLKMATHKPRMPEPPPPALELFDLDELLLDESTRLRKLTAKYHEDKELELFIEEAGLICIPDVCDDDEWRMNGNNLSKYLLYHIAEKIFQSKSLSITES
eukprot:scaffold26687_cov51-Cyclotella_meneghiniana.AAC.1